MIGYITLGSNNIKRTAEFYEPLMQMLGASRVFDHASYVAWSMGENSPIFSIAEPFDGKAASFGNGTMIALTADNRDQVNVLHARALSLGGKDEGAPGLRSGGYYCAYFRDPDGNKLNFHTTG